MKFNAKALEKHHVSRRKENKDAHSAFEIEKKGHVCLLHTHFDKIIFTPIWQQMCDAMVKKVEFESFGVESLLKFSENGTGQISTKFNQFMIATNGGGGIKKLEYFEVHKVAIKKHPTNSQ